MNIEKLDIEKNTKIFTILPVYNMDIENSIKYSLGKYAIMDPTINKKKLNNILQIINSSNLEQIIFVNYIAGYEHLIPFINEKIEIKFIWTTGIATLTDVNKLNAFNIMMDFYNKKYIKTIGFISKSMYETYSNKKYNCYNVNLDIRRITNNKSNISNDIAIIGNDFDPINNVYNMISACAMVKYDNVKIFGPKKVTKEFFELFNVKYKIENKLDKLITDNKINLLVHFSDINNEIVLKSIDNNIPCVLGNSDIFNDFAELKKMLVVDSDDDINEISMKIKNAEKNIKIILEEYKKFRTEYSKKSKNSIIKFLEIKETDYEKYIVNNKIIHYCWFGPRPLSKLALKCLDSWKKYLPDYDIIKWSEDNVDLNECPFIKGAYEQKKWAFVADYARTKALYQYGGLYLDTDVEIKKNPSFMMEHDTSLCIEDSKLVNGAVWWAKTSENKFVSEVLSFYQEQKAFDFPDLFAISIPRVFTKILNKYKLNVESEEIQILKNDICIYPREYFYPISYDYKDNKFTDNTCMIHWFDASWTSKYEQIKNYMNRHHMGLLFKIGIKIYYELCRIKSLFLIILNKLNMIHLNESKLNKLKNNISSSILLRLYKEYINFNKLSVIVPVYNTEKYLDRCLNSIVNARIANMEIIVINDGSTDDSEKIIKKYIKKYSRLFRYIKQENKGLGAVKNLGIQEAKGKYISFVDSDDSIDPNFYKEANIQMLKNIDIIVCDFNSIEENGYTYISKAIDSVIKIDNDYKSILYTSIMPSSCNKIFKRDLYINNGIHFPENHQKYEDLVTTPILLFKAKNIKYLNAPYYNYYIRNNSIMRTDNKADMIKAIALLEKRIKDFDAKYGDIEEFKFYTYFWRIEEEIINKIYNLNEKDRKDYVKFLYYELHESLLVFFKNKYVINKINKFEKRIKEYITKRNEAIVNKSFEEFINYKIKNNNVIIIKREMFYGKGE